MLSGCPHSHFLKPHQREKRREDKYSYPNCPINQYIYLWLLSFTGSSPDTKNAEGNTPATVFRKLTSWQEVHSINKQASQ